MVLRQSVAFTIAGVAAAILLGGCGSSGGSTKTIDGQASPPVVHDVKQRTSITGLTLPVDSFKPSPDQVLVINQATTSLVNACLQRFGFNSVLPAASKSAPETLARRYGVTDAKIATTYGYHLAPSEGVVADRKTSPTTPMSTSEMLVLTGSPTVGAPGATPKASNRTYNGQQVPVGGCLGEANTKLGNGSKYESGLNLIDDIDTGSYARAKVDPRVVAVFAKWSACMKQKGYSFADPYAAAESADLSTSTPSASEIQTAEADVACKTSTNVVGVYFAVESSYENVEIQKDIQQLRDFQKLTASAVTLAAQTVGVTPPK
jgi:hypothetical protein